jgi:hypothetical protein
MRAWQIWTSQRPASKRDYTKDVDEMTEQQQLPATQTPIPLGQRFPAAHQFLRLKLIEEIFPIAPSIACWAQSIEPDVWLVRLTWPEIDYEASRRFSAEELRGVFGPWSNWARNCALDVADRLPV